MFSRTWDPRLDECPLVRGILGAFSSVPPSLLRAGTSVNVRVTMWEMEWLVSPNSYRWTAAYRTTDSATQMLTVQTSTSRVSVARALAQCTFLFGLG